MAETDPRKIVEDAQAYLAPHGSIVVEDFGDVVVRHAPFSPQYWFGAATRPRFTSTNADTRIADVRRWFRDKGREEFMWMVGESATPSGLVERLIAIGAALDDDDPVGTAMVLEREPPPGPLEIEVRRVTTFEEFRESSRITLAEVTPEVWAATEAKLEAAWAETRENTNVNLFLAYADGQPIANAQLVWLSNGLPYLGGATTRKEFRGRGAFTALVRARWDAAVAHGMPILLVQAGQMSGPILTSLGFEPVAKITMLRDHA